MPLKDGEIYNICYREWGHGVTDGYATAPEEVGHPVTTEAYVGSDRQKWKINAVLDKENTYILSQPTSNGAWAPRKKLKTSEPVILNVGDNAEWVLTAKDEKNNIYRITEYNAGPTAVNFIVTSENNKLTIIEGPILTDYQSEWQFIAIDG